MLTINVPGIDLFDEEKNLFIVTEPVTLELEHSLVSLSKWESSYKKPFLGRDTKSKEETLGYIKAMVLTEDIPQNVFSRLSKENFDAINSYISDTMTATWFTEIPGQSKNLREIVTAEIIYYWLVTLQIPFECQYWHLNRLFTLVKVISEKNAPKKNIPKKDLAAQQAALNAARRQEYNTTG